MFIIPSFILRSIKPEYILRLYIHAVKDCSWKTPYNTAIPPSGWKILFVCPQQG